jgi:uncharacterized protein
MKRLLLAIIRAYQFLLSPWVGNQCRFYPTCSHYAAEAIDRHGALCGSWLALRRISKCHPWHPGGMDPVPEQPTCGCSGKHREPPR